VAASDPGALRARLALAGLGAAALAGGGLLRQLDPSRPGSGLPPCPFHWLTGLYCPGCGATRAAHALAHFDPAGALAMNPLLVLAVPLVVLLLAGRAGWLPGPPRAWLERMADARPWAIAVVAFMVARNLPWPPFSWLAPGT